ncbi:MAG: TIR domain-containing protein, partial [Hyphomicrobiaceae bacterium]|nr:TIR domain-containing protein [Hyphomicrobiaceae bacterium]
MSALVNLKYRAFLSYAHADVRWAKWLHGRLEGFRVDKDLVGRETALGPVPKALRPIFRDREDFSGGHSLTEATIAALDASAALVVLCSTVAATRPAVNEEVRLFRHRHPGRPVIPVIVDGTYPDNFPPALRYEIEPDGTVSDRPVTILAADLQHEPRTVVLAKTIAALVGLDPIDISRRVARAERRRAWAIGGTAASMVALMAAGGWFYWQAQQRGQIIVTQQQREREAIKLARDLLRQKTGQAAPGQEQDLITAIWQLGRDADAGDAIAARVLKLLREGKVKEAVQVRIAAAEAAERRAQVERKKAAQNYREAAALAAVAEPGKARALYAKAAALDPTDIEGLFQHGWFQQQAGNLASAEAAYRKVIAHGKPGKHDVRLYWATLGLGDIQVARGDLGGAKATYEAARAIAERLAKADPNNAGRQRDLSVSYEKVGSVLVAQGNLTEALTSFRAQQAIAERLAKADPNNARWQRDLSVSYNWVGNV